MIDRYSLSKEAAIVFEVQGRCFPHDYLFSHFPQFAKLQAEAVEMLMVSDIGDLHIYEKVYIALMAVSCYECDYLYKTLKAIFLDYGGNPLWLTDIN